ncbi:MAG: TadE/TadG family type IV pilus assembly protein [Desulfurivibrionaceae bacterium]
MTSFIGKIKDWKDPAPEKRERGASAVEFALILPVLLLILFGIIEFGILLFDKAMLTNASREGARAGIVYDTPTRMTQDEIEEVVLNYCQAHLITFSDGSTDPEVDTDPPDPENLTSGDSLTVTVNYQYDFLLLPNLNTDLASGINLEATTTMRAE